MHEPAPDVELLRAAFRHLHGAHLHGFALVLVLGDRQLAAHLATEALAAISVDAPRLRHPERAAATLRAHVVNLARRQRPRPALDDERATTLTHLGLDRLAAAALGRLTLVDRAALLGGQIEGFAEDDLATILHTTPGRARRAQMDARHRYLAEHFAEPAALDDQLGGIAERVRDTAARTMGNVTH
ncbi:MAG: hypothetical protein ABI622_01095 [Chloroflexota bacterium]